MEALVNTAKFHDMEFMESMRDWYISTYPDDELGAYINQGITFEDLFDAMDNYQDVYKTIGVADSIVRERLFSRLAWIIGTDYDYVYGQWMSY